MDAEAAALVVEVTDWERLQGGTAFCLPLAFFPVVDELAVAEAAVAGATAAGATVAEAKRGVAASVMVLAEVEGPARGTSFCLPLSFFPVVVVLGAAAVSGVATTEKLTVVVVARADAVAGVAIEERAVVD